VPLRCQSVGDGTNTVTVSAIVDGAGMPAVCALDTNGQPISVSSSCDAVVRCICVPEIKLIKEVVCTQGTTPCGALPGAAYDGHTFANGVRSADSSQCPTFCYRIIIKNTGNCPLTSVNVSDPLFGSSLGGYPGSLDPGQSATNFFSKSLCAVTTNIATVLALTPYETTVSSTATADVNVVTAQISCAKSVSTNGVDFGPSATILQDGQSHQVIYKLVVQNLSAPGVVLSGFNITDANGCFGTVAPPASLASQASFTLFCTNQLNCTTIQGGTLTDTVAISAQVDSQSGAVCISRSNGLPVSVTSTCQAVVVCQPCTGQIGDFVWNDLDGNGCQDLDEPGLMGVKVDLYMGCTVTGAPFKTTTTDSTGHYLFNNLCPGQYTVSFNTPAGFTRTVAGATCPVAPGLPSDRNQTNSKCDCPDGTPCGVCVTLLTATSTNLNVDCGYVCNGQIGDFVWNDLNGNGCQDSNEPGLAGVKVDLYTGCGVTGTPLATTTTDSTGHYLFSGLCLGQYTVSFNTPVGFARTVAHATCTPNGNPPYSNQTDSKCDCPDGSPCGVCVTLTATTPVNLNTDCGYVCNGQIGNFVWNDLNGNGCQDASEPGIPGVKVDLYAGCSVTGTPLATTNTDSTGHYLFSGLCLGQYTVSFNTPGGLLRTVPHADCAPNDNPPYSNQTDSKCDCPDGTPCGVCVTLTATDPINLNIDCGYSGTPGIDCQKFAYSPDDVDGNPNDGHVTLPGDSASHSVAYSVLVTNTGNIDLTNVTISDSLLPSSCLPAPFSLAAGKSVLIPLCTTNLSCAADGNTGGSNCGNPLLGPAAGCTVLELSSGKVSMTGPAGGVIGDVCIGPRGQLEMSGSQYINGNVRLSPGAKFKSSAKGPIGMVSSNVDLSGEISAAYATASAAASRPCTQSFAKLDGKTITTITGVAGINVICVGDVTIAGKQLTLTGPVGAKFIFNVTGKFKLSGGGAGPQIRVAGGVKAADVLYNIIGSGEDVAFSGGGGGVNCCAAIVDGTILAPARKIALSPGLVNGGVISGKDISIVSGASVRCPPAPPVPPTQKVWVNTITVTATVGSSETTVSHNCSATVECCVPTKPCQPLGTCMVQYPFPSENPRTSVVFNESEVLRGFNVTVGSDGCTPKQIQVFYSDEHALTMGIRQTVVMTASNTSTMDYTVTPMGSANPSSAMNPLIGDPAGTDLAGRPIFPALFITDITNDPNSMAGDWQYGGTAHAPNAVFGTWKAAVQTIDQTKSPAVVTVTPDADPAKNDYNLGAGSDPVPAGLVNQGYGAEVRWDVSQLGLQAGHTYRMYFMVHDGDQNKSGGDVGHACATLTIGTGSTGGNPCPVTPPCQPLGPCSVKYPYPSENPLTSVAFNESEVLRAFIVSVANGCQPNQIQVFYNDEHALSLGVRRVIVKNSNGTTSITDIPISPLLSNPGSVTSGLQVGSTALTGDLAGTDLAGRPLFPSLFVSDITSDPNNTSGDWQFGGTAHVPDAVFGTWKGAVRTVDNTRTPAIVTVTPDPDPTKNGYNLGAGSDPVPTGLVNQGYGAEVRWNVSNLGLLPGHTYRMYFMVHDGDQNKSGGDVGHACATIAIPESQP
jgi:uncharacterized repeat protein (TIGR01451 family)